MYSWHGNNSRFDSHSSSLQALVLLETQPSASVPEISDRCFLLRSKRNEILYRPYLASSIASWCLPIFVELLRDELAACVSNSLCTFLLFSSLLFSIDWIIFFFTPGWFCKHGVKTSIRTRGKLKKRRLQDQEQDIGTRSESAISACFVSSGESQIPGEGQPSPRPRA